MKKPPGFLASLIGIIYIFCAPASAIPLQNGAIQFEIDPPTLQISVGDVVVNLPKEKQKVIGLNASDTRASWQWPERGLHVTAQLEGQELRLSFRSERPQILEWFILPSQVGTLLLPIGEGSRIPLDNALWQSYLLKEKTTVDTNFDLKLPLWGQEQEGKFYSWLLLAPFSNQVSFSKNKERLEMRSQHAFNRFNQQQPFEVLLHVGDTLLSGCQSSALWRHPSSA